MIVKMNIELRAREVLLMHKNCPHVFSKYIYSFMDYHGCSRTEEELVAISTDELLKDMWYLKITADSSMDYISIDYELLYRMLHELKCCGVEDVLPSGLMHEYAEAMLSSGEWENV